MKQSPCDLSKFVHLSHRRWSIPILGELFRTSGSKFVTLSRRLGIPEGSLRQSLQELIRLGYVVPNPGYGHPLRPEYILTRQGEKEAQFAFEVNALIEESGMGEVLYRKWMLAIIACCQHGDRYSEIRTKLESVTDRALSAALQELVGHEVLRREIVDSYPPTTVYLVRSEWIPIAAKLHDWIAA